MTIFIIDPRVDLNSEEFAAEAVATLDDQEFEKWIDYIANDQGDALNYLFDELATLSERLTPERMTRLCDSFDICPEHLCNREICADDEDDCTAGRESAIFARERLGL